MISQVSFKTMPPTRDYLPPIDSPNITQPNRGLNFIQTITSMPRPNSTDIFRQSNQGVINVRGVPLQNGGTVGMNDHNPNRMQLGPEREAGMKRSVVRSRTKTPVKIKFVYSNNQGVSLDSARSSQQPRPVSTKLLTAELPLSRVPSSGSRPSQLSKPSQQSSKIDSEIKGFARIEKAASATNAGNQIWADGKATCSCGQAYAKMEQLELSHQFQQFNQFQKSKNIQHSLEILQTQQLQEEHSKPIQQSQKAYYRQNQRQESMQSPPLSANIVEQNNMHSRLFYNTNSFQSQMSVYPSQVQQQAHRSPIGASFRPHTGYQIQQHPHPQSFQPSYDTLQTQYANHQQIAPQSRFQVSPQNQIRFIKSPNQGGRQHVQTVQYAHQTHRAPHIQHTHQCITQRMNKRASNHQQGHHQQANHQQANHQQPNYQQPNHQQPNHQQPNPQQISTQTNSIAQVSNPTKVERNQQISTSQIIHRPQQFQKGTENISKGTNSNAGQAKETLQNRVSNEVQSIRENPSPRSSDQKDSLNEACWENRQAAQNEPNVNEYKSQQIQRKSSQEVKRLTVEELRDGLPIRGTQRSDTYLSSPEFPEMQLPIADKMNIPVISRNLSPRDQSESKTQESVRLKAQESPRVSIQYDEPDSWKQKYQALGQHCATAVQQFGLIIKRYELFDQQLVNSWEDKAKVRQEAQDILIRLNKTQDNFSRYIEDNIPYDENILWKHKCEEELQKFENVQRECEANETRFKKQVLQMNKMIQDLVKEKEILEEDIRKSRVNQSRQSENRQNEIGSSLSYSGSQEIKEKKLRQAKERSDAFGEKIANLNAKLKAYEEEIEQLKYGQQVSENDRMILHQIVNEKTELADAKRRELFEASKIIQQLRQKFAENARLLEEKEMQLQEVSERREIATSRNYEDTLKTNIDNLKSQMQAREQHTIMNSKFMLGQMEKLNEQIALLNGQRGILKKESENKQITEQDDIIIRGLKQKIFVLDDQKLRQESEIRGLRQSLADREYESREQIKRLRRMLAQREQQIKYNEEKLMSIDRRLKEVDGLYQEKLNEGDQIKRNLSNYSNLEAEALGLENAMQRKSVQLESCARENEELRKELAKYQDELEFNSKNLRQAYNKIRDLEYTARHQNEMLEEANHKKDIEISKLKQQISLLESQIESANFEHKRIFTHEIQFKTVPKHEYLKIVERNQNIEIQSNAAQAQIQSLRKELQTKMEAFRDIESEAQALFNGVRHLEADNDKLSKEVNEMIFKNNETERRYIEAQRDLSQETQKRVNAVHNSEVEVGMLKSKVIELEAASKAKDSRVRQLQKKVQDLNIRIRRSDQNLLELENMNSKLGYERKIVLNRQSKAVDYTSLQIFESKLIYNLQTQLGELKGLKGSSKKGKDKSINKRLNDFDRKLQRVIGGKQIEVSPSRVEKVAQVSYPSLLKEIHYLQMRVMELEGGKQSRNEADYLNPESVFNERMTFYRDKVKSLEDLLDQNIRVNKELKDNLHSMLKSNSLNGEEHTITYYRNETVSLTAKVAYLQGQLGKMSQDYERKEETSKRLISNDSYTKLDDVRISSDLDWRINQLTLKNGILEKEKSAFLEDVTRLNKEISKLKLILEEVNLAKSALEKSFQEKAAMSDIQINSLSAKTKTLQEQISALTQNFSQRRQGVSQAENRAVHDLQEELWKSRQMIDELKTQLEQQVRDLQRAEGLVKTFESEKAFSEGREIALQAKLKTVERQLLEVTEAFQTCDMNLKLANSSNSRFQINQAQWTHDQQMLKARVSTFEQELLKINELNARRISEKDTEIGQLKSALAGQTKKAEQLNDKLVGIKTMGNKTSAFSSEESDLRAMVERYRYTTLIQTHDLNVKREEFLSLTNQLQEAHQKMAQYINYYDSSLRREQRICQSLNYIESNLLELNQVIEEMNTSPNWDFLRDRTIVNIKNSLQEIKTLTQILNSGQCQ